MGLKEMIEAIRKAISKCDAGERELYEALVDEASGWEMRLQEIEEEGEDADIP